MRESFTGKNTAQGLAEIPQDAREKGNIGEKNSLKMMLQMQAMFKKSKKGEWKNERPKRAKNTERIG